MGPDSGILERDLLWTRRTIVYLTVAGGSGLLVLSFTALWSAGGAAFLKVLGSGVLVASAAFSVGGLIGFLFAIPRAPGAGQGGGNAPQPSRPYYQQNTNLEQISDWLTKVLVGASLTQVTLILEAMRRGAREVAAGAGPPFAEAAAWALMIHFGATGFLAGYLLTALFLGGALSRAQRDAGRLAEQLRDVDDKTRLTESISALTDAAKGKQALTELREDVAAIDQITDVKHALQRRVRDARASDEIATVLRAFRNAGILRE